MPRVARYWDMKYGDFKISIDLENESVKFGCSLAERIFF